MRFSEWVGQQAAQGLSDAPRVKAGWAHSSLASGVSDGGGRGVDQQRRRIENADVGVTVPKYHCSQRQSMAA